MYLGTAITCWPARSASAAPTPWEAMKTARTVYPRTERPRPAVTAPPADPPARPRRVEHPEARPRLDDITGTAMFFERWFRPTVQEEHEGTKFFVLPGALDESLAEIRAGRATFALCLMHGAQLASSISGTITARVRGDRLILTIRGDRLESRHAIRAIRRFGFRELSVGLSCEGLTGHDPNTGDRLYIVQKAALKEISVVTRGAGGRKCCLKMV